MIPAVLYGGDREPRTIAVSPRSVVEILQSESGQNSILNLKVADGPEQTALIHDYQVDPISHRLLHADFKRIDMNVAVEVDVPIEIIGEAVGVKVDKGILDQIIRELQHPLSASRVRSRIEFVVDVTELNIGDSIQVDGPWRCPRVSRSLPRWIRPSLLVAPLRRPRIEVEDRRRRGPDRRDGRARGHRQGQTTSRKRATNSRLALFESMRAIAGLGNPGATNTPTPDTMPAGCSSTCLRRTRQGHGASANKEWVELEKLKLGPDAVWLMRPKTYMNGSGRWPVEQGCRSLQIEARDVLVAYDDVDLPLGQIRIRRGGGSGGHRGLESVIAELGFDRRSPDFRIGVRGERSLQHVTPPDYVLVAVRGG